jgi:nitrite reductase/ring-hydroxylating ferredoxin subunit
MPASRKVRVGAVEDFVEGKFALLTVESRQIGIIRLPSGTFRAVLNSCPHKGAPVCKGLVGGTWLPSSPGELKFDRGGEVLICPWHGFEYDLVSGEELYQDRPTRLRMYPTSVDNGELMIEISTRASRD